MSDNEEPDDGLVESDLLNWLESLAEMRNIDPRIDDAFRRAIHHKWLMRSLHELGPSPMVEALEAALARIGQMPEAMRREASASISELRLLAQSNDVSLAAWKQAVLACGRRLEAHLFGGPFGKLADELSDKSIDYVYMLEQVYEGARAQVIAESVLQRYDGPAEGANANNGGDSDEGEDVAQLLEHRPGLDVADRLLARIGEARAGARTRAEGNADTAEVPEVSADPTSLERDTSAPLFVDAADLAPGVPTSLEEADTSPASLPSSPVSGELQERLQVDLLALGVVADNLESLHRQTRDICQHMGLGLGMVDDQAEASQRSDAERAPHEERPRLLLLHGGLDHGDSHPSATAGLPVELPDEPRAGASRRRLAMAGGLAAVAAVVLVAVFTPAVDLQSDRSPVATELPVSTPEQRDVDEAPTFTINQSVSNDNMTLLISHGERDEEEGVTRVHAFVINSSDRDTTTTLSAGGTPSSPPAATTIVPARSSRHQVVTVPDDDRRIRLETVTRYPGDRILSVELR